MFQISRIFHSKRLIGKTWVRLPMIKASIMFSTRHGTIQQILICMFSIAFHLEPSWLFFLEVHTADLIYMMDNICQWMVLVTIRPNGLLMAQELL
ncbi:MAG TPA: hypothetical protein DCG54_12915 [Anaerolineae bacterium]|nr:hypothetical protein [Anaerolineae bacterium]